VRDRALCWVSDSDDIGGDKESVQLAGLPRKGEMGWFAWLELKNLIDEASLLACAANVDLNPIRAAMAKTLELLGKLSLALPISE
jgi:hypothetical protein